MTAAAARCFAARPSVAAQPSNPHAAANGKILILDVPYSERGKTHRRMRGRTESIPAALAAPLLFALTDGDIDVMHCISAYDGGPAKISN